MPEPIFSQVKRHGVLTIALAILAAHSALAEDHVYTVKIVERAAKVFRDNEPAFDLECDIGFAAEGLLQVGCGDHLATQNQTDFLGGRMSMRTHRAGFEWVINGRPQTMPLDCIGAVDGFTPILCVSAQP